MLYKKCPKCKELKLYFEYHKSSITKDGLFYCCIICYSKYYKRDRDKDRNWRKNNKEKILESAKTYRSINKNIINQKAKEYHKTIEGKMTEYKYAAKKRDLPFKLTKDDFQSFWQKPCYYCGTTINTIGIDRLEAEQGYIKENCVSCCYTCNKAKSDMNIDEFIAWIKKAYLNLF